MSDLSIGLSPQDLGGDIAGAAAAIGQASKAPIGAGSQPKVHHLHPTQQHQQDSSALSPASLSRVPRGDCPTLMLVSSSSLVMSRFSSCSITSPHSALAGTHKPSP